MAGLFDAFQLELKKGTPDKATALIRVIERELYLRDRADGAIQQQIDWLKEKVKSLARDEA